MTRRSTEGISTHTFLWIDEQGEILRREEVATGEASFLESPSFVSCMLAVAVPAPAIVTPVLIFAFPGEYLMAGEAADYPSAMGMALSDTWPVLLLINLVGVALAWLCYRRQKTYDQPASWVWVGFVFLLGVPALLGYLFHRRWAVREICPACKAIAPRDRESCFSCGEEFPQPARRGTEVLV